MQEERKYLEELFQKYQQGLVTEEEKQIIAKWLVHLDASERQLPEDIVAGKQEHSLNELTRHIFPQTTDHPKIIRFPFWLRSVAASILVVLAVGGVIYLSQRNRVPAAEQTVFAEMSTKTGEMKRVTLTDGTKITLNNQSKIKYPVSFNGKTREVFLLGEAFFEVAHNTTKPFKVHTDKIAVQVLGTSFDIKAYQEDKRLYVSVASGKVGVLPTAKGSKTYFLLPGDQIAYNRSTGKFSEIKIDAESIAAWQKGILTFNNETLAGIARQLERFYKVTFQFENKDLLKKELSLKVKNQSLQVVMKALSLSGDFHYKIEGNKVKIW